MFILSLSLSLLLVFQVIKIHYKQKIIDKNEIDYCFEYIACFFIFGVLFFIKKLSFSGTFIFTLLLVVYEIISGIVLVKFYWKKEKLNELSIKKVIDSSEVGILILKGNRKVLMNSAMQEILNHLEIQEDYISKIEACSQKQMDGHFVASKDPKTYLFCIEQNEITAFDITEEYLLQQKLEEQNQKIKQNNDELMVSIQNIEKLEKEKNLLKIKNKYHDLLGQNLSILQQYLNKEEIKKENVNEIKYMIQKMFGSMEDSEDSNHDLQELIQIHKKMGTNIMVKGNLPQDKKIAKVFFEIIREATTNAIKHAGSSQILVEIAENLEETKMKITNDGKKPNEFITENEGIKGMRRKVEEINGYFYVSTIPEFSVNVSLKRKI